MRITWSGGNIEKWRLPLKSYGQIGKLVGQGPISNARQLSTAPQ